MYYLDACLRCLKRAICKRTIKSVMREGCTKFEDQQDMIMSWEKRD